MQRYTAGSKVVRLLMREDGERGENGRIWLLIILRNNTTSLVVDHHVHYNCLKDFNLLWLGGECVWYIDSPLIRVIE